MDWNELFRDTWQTGLVFLSLIGFTRFLGNTQIGQLTFYEYVSGITIGSVAATVVASEPDRVWSHFYDLALFTFLTYFVSYITIKSRKLRKLIEGSPTVVIQNGCIIRKNMQSLRYDIDELNGQLRQQGILDMSEIQYAIVETSGELSIVKKAQYQPVTRCDLGINGDGQMFPVELIMDGELVEENFKKHKYSEEWLRQKLLEQGITSKSEVNYAAINSKGNFYVCRNTDSGFMH